jgi:hypothetical protein
MQCECEAKLAILVRGLKQRCSLCSNRLGVEFPSSWGACGNIGSYFTFLPGEMLRCVINKAL